MMHYVPVDFSWLGEEEMQNFKIYSMKEYSSLGYILEFDLENPNQLQDGHADLPILFWTHISRCKEKIRS